MSETLSRPFWAPPAAPKIEPTYPPYCEEMERRARADEKDLEKLSDMLKECHKFGIKLQREWYFARELDGLPQRDQSLANAIDASAQTDITYIWGYMS